MKIKTLLAGAALAIVSLAAASTQAAGNLVVNGDFSNPNVGGGYTIGAIPGWTDASDGVEVGNTAVYGLPSYGGNDQLMEINANTFDTVTQTITGLTAGDSYTLSYAYGGRPGGGPQELNVSFGSTLLTTETGSFGVWTPNSFVVVADASSEVLTFQSVDVGGLPSYGNEISTVSLSAIPEPATWAFMMIGFGAVGASMRSRRKSLTVAA